jgi:hypothetical protein
LGFIREPLCGCKKIGYSWFWDGASAGRVTGRGKREQEEDVVIWIFVFATGAGILDSTKGAALATAIFACECHRRTFWIAPAPDAPSA